MGINDVLDSVWGDELSADATGKWRSLPNRNCMKTVLVLRGFFRAHDVALVDRRADGAELGAGQHDEAIGLVVVGMQL